MKKVEAERTLEEMLEIDSLGIVGSMSDEQIAAIKKAYQALKNPECMTCGYCQRFANETAEGDGWCEQRDRKAFCDDPACGYYELDEQTIQGAVPGIGTQYL